MTISRSRGTIGVRWMPDDLDSGYCSLRHNAPGIVRVNLDGIWTVLCEEHVRMLEDALKHPEASPEPKPPPEPRYELVPEDWEEWWDD